MRSIDRLEAAEADFGVTTVVRYEYRVARSGGRAFEFLGASRQGGVIGDTGIVGGIGKTQIVITNVAQTISWQECARYTGLPTSPTDTRWRKG